MSELLSCESGDKILIPSVSMGEDFPLEAVQGITRGLLALAVRDAACIPSRSPKSERKLYP